MKISAAIAAVGLLFSQQVLAVDNTSTTMTYSGSSFEITAVPGVPLSKLPAAARRKVAPLFQLTGTNALTMKGMNDPQNERWLDCSGNIYSAAFMSGFDYEKPSTNGPIVRVRVDGQSTTFSGRLEARGLKPNFAYQMKLRGVFADRKSFEAIGYAGRWRLPGITTNYRDDDYETYENKEAVEAYIFFDFFVTDEKGNAVREFALDSSLHVLWNASHQYMPEIRGDMLIVRMKVYDPKTYARPKGTIEVEGIWAERELTRYKSADQVKFLPEGQYTAELVLTEESFHSWYEDGGYWATVFSVPVRFSVVAKPEMEEQVHGGKDAADGLQDK